MKQIRKRYISSAPSGLTDDPIAKIGWVVYFRGRKAFILADATCRLSEGQ